MGLLLVGDDANDQTYFQSGALFIMR